MVVTIFCSPQWEFESPPFTSAPIPWEAEKRADSGSRPASLYLPIAASPAEAMQPHSAQTGRPPNWQGVIRVAKSAEIHVHACAKMQVSGDFGGSKYPFKMMSDISSFGKEVRNRKSSRTAFDRSWGFRRSSESSPS